MWGPRAAGILVVVLLAGSAGCTTAVTGTGVAAPSPSSTSTPTGSAPTGSTPTGSTPTGSTPTGSTPPPARSALAADVLPDECLLDALAFSALLGRPVLPPEQGAVVRADGSSSSSCVAASAGGFPDPLAAVNVYRPRSGTPAEFVRAGPPEGRRELAGLGEAAVLVDTAPGVTLQLAAPRYVVTIAVLDGAPSDDAWRTAAAAALAALPA